MPAWREGMDSLDCVWTKTGCATSFTAPAIALHKAQALYIAAAPPQAAGIKRN
jgi:hypothetical protein